MHRHGHHQTTTLTISRPNLSSAKSHLIKGGKIRARSRSGFEFCSSLAFGLSTTILLNLLIILQVPIAGINAYQQQQLQPSFIKSMDGFAVKENTPIGSIVYKLEANVDGIEGAKIQYSIEGTDLFRVDDKWDGDVMINSPIDRESIGDEVTFKVIATRIVEREPVSSTTITVSVIIVDENDNSPAFESIQYGPNTELVTPNSKFEISIPETLAPGRLIVDQINIVDADKITSFRYSCAGCEPKFEIISMPSKLPSSSSLSLAIRAKESMRSNHNVIQTPMHSLQLIVGDGKFNSSLMFSIHIEKDLNVEPLKFSSALSCTIRENLPIDTTIMKLQAVVANGDNRVGGDQNLTSLQRVVNSTSGAAKRVIYDLYNDQINSYGSTSDVFKLNPLTGELQLAQKLDREAYLSQNGIIMLKVRARELSLPGAESGQSAGAAAASKTTYDEILDSLRPFIEDSSAIETNVKIIIVDLNDNQPQWLNFSELAATHVMQSSSSPLWFARLAKLSTDQRLGGGATQYKLSVHENSLPGTPLSSRNDMFVYDLDNGPNATFAISLEDKFNLFEVEPKQIAGFGIVSIKLARQAAPRILDYENHNDRKFIIELVATESETAERFSTRTQVEIHVLDVNDNAPRFKEHSYDATISEDAPAGKSVVSVQATDRDEISKTLIYKLHGKTAYLFDMHKFSGLVSVAQCGGGGGQNNAAHHQALGHQQQQQHHRFRHHQLQADHQHHPQQNQAQQQCLDREAQKSHHLIVEVSDGEFSSKVPLTVYVEDVSDNAPVFHLPVVDVVIEEGDDEIRPPIRIEASDLDETSAISYSIIEGNFEGLFAINNVTGDLQLTRSVHIAHDNEQDDAKQPPHHHQHQQRQLNKMTLIVEAFDGNYRANCTVRIDILDSNDNAPQFYKSHYAKEIDESSSPGQHVINVQAYDLDRGNNARVSYRIERGSYSQFEIDPTYGNLTVARNAQPFVAERRRQYSIEVVAYDHGLAPKSSSTLVQVSIADSNKLTPRFEPQTQHTSVSEKTSNKTIIYRMRVANEEERLENQLLFLPGPIEAVDKQGHTISLSERLDSMFSVSANSGDVMVNSELDHQFAAYVNLTIYLTRNTTYSLEAGDPPPSSSKFSPRSVGYLTINVMDYNDNPPLFGAPWSLESPDLHFRMPEELPVGSVLTQLIATDPDSKISHYKIDPPNEYFELTSSQSGLIVNKRLIDYEVLMQQRFLKPGSRLPNSADSSSSAIVGSGSVGNNIIQFHVYAYDFGEPQLHSRATISVEILPVNDNDCKFEKPLYEKDIKENLPVDTMVEQVRAIDLDFNHPHNQISYQLVGAHREYFNIESKTGIVTISKRGSFELDRESLNESTIVLTVIGREGGSDAPMAGSASLHHHDASSVHFNSRICTTTLKINVQDVNDNGPIFLNRTYEVTVFDTKLQEAGVLKLHIRDDDLISQQAQTFDIIQGNVNQTFRISDAGLLYLVKPLSQASPTTPRTFELKVRVRQRLYNQNYATDDCTVLVHYVDTNQNVPEWKIEKFFSIKENSKPGTLVTKLNCTDKDLQFKSLDMSLGAQKSHQNMMRYWIRQRGLNLEETPEFKLNPVTGELFSKIELDRETKNVYQLIVVCEDNGLPQSLSSLASIEIQVDDVDDNKPEFVLPATQDPRSKLFIKSSAHQSFIANSNTNDNSKVPKLDFLVEEQQSRGLQVGELRAVDADAKSVAPISYCIIDGNEFQEFKLDKDSGILYTNKTLDREKQVFYELTVKAINDGSTCDQNRLLQATNSSSSLPSMNGIQDHESPIAFDTIMVRIQVLDINDNSPVFKLPLYRAGIHHKSLMNTLVTQIVAYDPDYRQNGTVDYKISECRMLRSSTTNQQHHQGVSGATGNGPHHYVKPWSIPPPFTIDQDGSIYTKQLMTEFQLDTVFLLQIEAQEQSHPRRVAKTMLEIYVYETMHQLKMDIQLHPARVEEFRYEIEQLLSNATKFSAIINRARSYDGPRDRDSKIISADKFPIHPSSQPLQNNNNNNIFAPEASQLAAATQPQQLPAIYTNILLIFVDNYSIVNPNLVMEKLDLTSAQLFKPPHLLDAAQFFAGKGLTAAGLMDAAKLAGGDNNKPGAQEISSLIDRVALASVQSPEQYRRAAQTFWSGLDWLENPSVLFVVLNVILLVIGFIVFLFGCCCKARIKDHIIKAAMEKMVRQQNMQAKINEQMLAASNHMNGGSMLGIDQQQHNQRPLPNLLANDDDFINSQVGFMSSFDATKGCIKNNNQNMNLIQRAMEAGDEFIDPNYNNHSQGHYNLASHYYDTSEIDDHQGQPMNGDLKSPGGHMQMTAKNVNDDSNVLSITMDDDVDDNYIMTNGAQNPQLLKQTKVPNNYNNNNNNNHNHVNGSKMQFQQQQTQLQRQRQQVPK